MNVEPEYVTPSPTRFLTATLPGMHEAMLAARATNVELAERAGVATSLVAHLRLGGRAQLKMVSYVAAALNAGGFTYKIRYNKRSGVRHG